MPDIENTNPVAFDEEHLKIIQDFHNKKANAHATIFVASMFALFSVLSLMTKIVTNVSSLAFLFSTISYSIIWLFGGYSLLNFFFYTTISQCAKHKITKGTDKTLFDEAIETWDGVLKLYARKVKLPKLDIKVTKESSKQSRARFYGRLRGLSSYLLKHNADIFVFLYCIVGWFPFIAFLSFLLA